MNYFVFDVIQSGYPFFERKKIAENWIKTHSRFNIKFIEHTPVYSASQVYEKLYFYYDLGFEGVILRDPFGDYKEGHRGKEIIKVNVPRDIRSGRLISVKVSYDEKNKNYTAKLLTVKTTDGDIINVGSGFTDHDRFFFKNVKERGEESDYMIYFSTQKLHKDTDEIIFAVFIGAKKC